MGKIYTQKPPVGSTINWSHPLSQGLVGCWLFNDRAGKAHDLVKDRHGVSYGGLWGFYYNKQVWMTDVAGTYMDMPATFPAMTDFSFVMQIANRSTGYAQQDICGFQTSNIWATTDSYNAYINWLVNCDTTYSQVRTNQGVPINAHLAFTYRDTDSPRYGKIFLAGKEVSYDYTKVGEGTIKPTNGVTFRFGGAISGWGGWAFNYFYMFNRRITPQEILSLYQAPYQFIKRRSSKGVKYTLFDAQKANIIAGLDSAQSEANGWDATVKTSIPASSVVRTSDTVVTITLPATATYDITAQETITATVPATALAGAEALVASPTFTIDPVSASTTHLLSLTGVGK